MSKEKANEQINQQVSPQEEKKHTKLIIAIIVIVCVLVGIILYLVLGKDAKPESKQGPTNHVVTPDNIDDLLAQMAAEDKTPLGSYEVTMTSDWEFENGSAVSSNAYVENKKNNQNTVYFTIEREDNGSVIYKSPYLPVGSSLENIKLDTSLAAGVYDTVMTYHLVDEENQEVSTVSLALGITIKN